MEPGEIVRAKVSKRGQMRVTIPKNSSISDGDHVLISKIDKEAIDRLKATRVNVINFTDKEDFDWKAMRKRVKEENKDG